MEWNVKWDCENLDVFNSKANESPSKLQVAYWGTEEGDVNAGSLNLSRGYGGSVGSASDGGHFSSAKSSISASTDCSPQEVMRASNFTFESFGKFPGESSKKEELARAEKSGPFPSLESSTCSGEQLTGLRLGKRKYFENNCAGSSVKTLPPFSVIPVSSTTMAKKFKLHCQNETITRCQVEGCNLDLSSAKDYHRKHRVCESHSKCPKVVVGGLERRFCQQCSRFHGLSEFDEKKRSCRKRLSDHNARRRKPQQETIQFNSTSMFSSIYDGRQQMSFELNNVPLPQSRPARSSVWESTYIPKYALAKGCLWKPEKAGVADVLPHLPVVQSSHVISAPNHYSSRLLQCKESSEVSNQGLRESVLSANLNAAPDFRRALSLLSTDSCVSREPEAVTLDHSVNASMPRRVVHTMSQDLQLASSERWRTEVHSTGGHMHVLTAHGNNTSTSSNFQEFQIFKSPYESDLYFNSLN